MKISILVLALVALVQADMYLHNPRGSNNRLDEARRDRNNANRLFDSQNNNRGGYNVGSLYYYAGSILPIEWTNQHSCGDPNNNCEIIFQYMCDDNLRDGASTNTIPENPVLCENYDCNTDLEFGMHESFDYYLDCRLRQRNMGLFSADQNLINRNNARFTRQNPNGNRRGYECPEERDYYPYWHPTPWRDIAVLTNDATRCPYYQRESANVKSRFACVIPNFELQNNVFNIGNDYEIPNTQIECEQLSYFNEATGNNSHAEWVEFGPDPRLSAPECVETLWSRDNHLGNSFGGFPNYFNWTIPDIPHDNCVLRARYNISTGEYDGFDSSVNSTISRITEDIYNSDSNEVNLRTPISELDIYSQFGFDYETAKSRGYVFRQNPVVKIFDDPSEGSVNFGLQLAINTNQFGRTFQDRSHSFAIRSQTSDLGDCDGIYNLNVRGKRGNIVQVYPGVEYDFVPNRLTVSDGSCIHIQWTGSNTNPHNNDGQGLAGTDRSNIVLLRTVNYPEGTRGRAVPLGMENGHWGNSYPAQLDDDETFLGLSRQLREDLALLTPTQFGGEMSELDDAGTYYDLGPQRITQRGTYYYMCSRNNNFTNRSQKGKIIVVSNGLAFKRIGWNGGSVEMGGTSVTFDQGDLPDAVVLRMESYPTENEALDMIEDMTGVSTSGPGDEVSQYYLVDPIDEFHQDASDSAEIQIELDSSSATNVKIYRANAGTDWRFRELDTRTSNGMAMASTREGGMFVAASPAVALYISIATVVFFLVIVTIAIVGVVIYFRVRREKWHAVKNGMKNFKRSFTDKV